MYKIIFVGFLLTSTQIINCARSYGFAPRARVYGYASQLHGYGYGPRMCYKQPLSTGGYGGTDRGYIVNERNTAVTVHLEDMHGIVRKRYHIYPGHSQRVMRSFNAIKNVIVNGQPLNKCSVPGQEHEIPIGQSRGETILIKEDHELFPYLECVDEVYIE